MGISTQSKVAFICRDDESAWAQPFIDEMKIPTTNAVGGFKTIDLPGAGVWEEDCLSVPVYECDVSADGRVITLGSDYYGVLNPARMDLPASLEAVVAYSFSCQDEEQDPMYAVLAQNVRQHEFDDKSLALIPYWFNYRKREQKLNQAIEYAVWDEEKGEETQDSALLSDQVTEALDKQRVLRFQKLISEVQSREDLTTPLLENTELQTVAGFLKSIDNDDADPEDWYEDFAKLRHPPRWDRNNTEIIGISDKLLKEALELNPETMKVVEDGLKMIAEEEVQAAEKWQFCKPTKTGLSRDKYVAALKEASAGGDDVTGCWRYFQSVLASGDYHSFKEGHAEAFWNYLIARFASETSPSAVALLNATEGEQVGYQLKGLICSGRFARDLEEGQQAVVKAPTTQAIEYIEAEGYDLLLLIPLQDYHDYIKGDPQEEKEWQEVTNEAEDEILYRYKPGKAVLKPNGERLTEEEYADLYKMSLDVITFAECAYSPTWANGFDYYPLWEAASSDGSIDGDEVDVDKLSQMIKERKYWTGDKGGYVVSTVKQTKLTDDEWMNFYENIETVGEEVFTNAVWLYVLNQEFTMEAIVLLKEIYKTTDKDEIGLSEMPSQPDFVNYCKQAVIEFIQEEYNTQYQLECPFFDFLGLYFALSSTDLNTNLELLKFVQRHPEHPHLAKRYAEFMLCSNESGMEYENYVSLQEPFWSVIKDHIVGNKNIPNPFYSGSGNMDEIFCNDWDEKIADLIENPEVIEVFTKAGFTVVPRKLETIDEKSNRHRLTLEKREEYSARAAEDAQGPHCSSYLRTLLNKLKEADTPDVPAMIVLSKLIWFFQRSNWGSEEYQADAKAIGIEPYQPETFNDAFTEMMLKKYCTDDLADGEWQLNMSQQLLKEWEQNTTEAGQNNPAKLSADEWKTFCELILEAGDNEAWFSDAIHHYVLNQSFTDKSISKFEIIYKSTPKEKLGLTEMPSQSDFISYCKQALLEIVSKEGYLLDDKDFDFLQLYFMLLREEGDEFDACKKLVTFVESHPEQHSLIKKFAAFMLDGTDYGMQHDCYLSFKEPIWSAIKNHIVGNDEINNFFYENWRPVSIDCADWVDKVATLLENPEVIEIAGKAGVTIIPRIKESAVPTIQIKSSHICITGQLTKTRKEYEDAIEAAGGINAKSVTKTTDILVCNLDHSSKKDKAIELGIPIITEDQLIAALDSV